MSENKSVSRKPRVDEPSLDLRNRLLGQQVQFVTRIIKYYPPVYKEEEDGSMSLDGYDKEPIEVMVKQPSVKERNDLYKACMDDSNNIDVMEFSARCVIAFTHDPETRKRLFEETDYDSLVAQPAGGFVDQFSTVASELMNIGGLGGNDERPSPS